MAVTVAGTAKMVHGKVPYSKNGKAGTYAWFSHEEDRMTVYIPDKEQLSGC